MFAAVATRVRSGQISGFIAAWCWQGVFEPSMTPFDRKLMLRSLAYTAMAAVVATAVVAATDEPLSTSRLRVARLAAFLPALAAIGCGIALRHAESRGEGRALAALGVSPLRSALGALLAGWAVGLAAVLLVASPWADLRSLFPVALSVPPWVRAGSGFVNPAYGILAREAGLEFSASARPPSAQVVPGVRAALAAIAPLAAVLPLWQSAPIAASSRLFGGAGALGLLLGLLHAVAAGRSAELWLPVASLPLAAQAALAHRRGA